MLGGGYAGGQLCYTLEGAVKLFARRTRRSVPDESRSTYAAIRALEAQSKAE